MANGTLFIEAFLQEGIREQAAWRGLSDDGLRALRGRLAEIFAAFPTARKPTESETEDDLIWPVLKVLGWTDFLRQQNLSQVGRSYVPDGLLFGDAEAKSRAYEDHSSKRFRDGLAIVESKRWNRPLDREDRTAKGDETAPSTQMLRYLRRIEDWTGGGVRWGILTNGRLWRLYYQGARSVAEDFFEIDLGETLGVAGCEPDLFSTRLGDADHRLKLFALLFGRDAFIAKDAGRTFHDDVLAEGRYWEESVTESLSDTVFETVFPALARTLAAQLRPGDPLSPAMLEEVREAALILLYRLLFVLYAEDRNLLPDESGPYKDYCLTRMRNEIAQGKDVGQVFPEHTTGRWSRLKDIFRFIGEGNNELGIPPYNGGLFAPGAAPLLESAQLSDAVIADTVYRLSHQSGDGSRYINYRDLSVQQLGSIYERILEYEIVTVEGPSRRGSIRSRERVPAPITRPRRWSGW